MFHSLMSDGRIGGLSTTGAPVERVEL